MNPNEKEKLIELIDVLRRERLFIIKVTVVGFVLSIAFVLLLKNQYQSTVTILPETDKSKLMGLSGLADLASLAGMEVGQTPLEKLYPVILESESSLKGVIYAQYKTQKFNHDVNLIEYFEIKGDSDLIKYERMLKLLRNMLDISQDKQTNVVTMTLETEEPGLSANILSNVTNELDDFLRTKNRSNATEQRKWIETRLKQVAIDLENSEDSLTTFRAHNRVTSQSPDLVVKEQRLLRAVDLSTSLYLDLKRRYEIAKVDEIKNVPLLNILDSARPAALKSSPRRTVTVLFLTLLAAVFSSLYVLASHRLPERLRDYVEIVKKLFSLVKLK